MKECRKCGVDKDKSEYYKKHLDCKPCVLAQRRKHYAENKDLYREKELKKNYNLSLAEYEDMYEEQEGCCAICGTFVCSSGKLLSVDHDHTTGQVRGLLCLNCNTAIGKFNDNQDLLYRAADYIRATSK